MINLQITVSDLAAPALQRLRTGLANRGSLHARMAGDAERFVKDRGAVTSRTEHRSAEKLGARPTNHLYKAYQAIESDSNADAAILRIPRASRLRAAFGDYVLRPGSGKKYLTIPVHRDAYGKRAGEFSNLFFVRVGPRMTPALARPVSTGEGLEIMYFLTKSSRIREDRGLIPFDDLTEEAMDSARAFVDELIGGVA